MPSTPTSFQSKGNHVLVPIHNLPERLKQAIIAIEDRNFFHHKGIDLRGIGRAIFARIRGSKLKQGASTITQQLVRHFLLSRDKTLERKAKEAVLSIYLEQKMSKEKILELYTNVLFLGNGAYGVGAAAYRYFGRPINDLKLHEFALIAGLFQSPSRYNPQNYPGRAKKRQRQVLRAMYECGMITKQQYIHAKKTPLVYKTYRSVNTKVAPYFLDYVKDQAESILGRQILNRGLRINTTLDPRLQKVARKSFQEKKEIFQKARKWALIPYKYKRSNPKIQGSLLTINPQTGEVLAMVGGRNYNKSKFNRTIQSKRQPGSAFKPIIYSLALAKGMKWSDLIYVSPVAVNNYRPKNFSRMFLTETTLQRAFFKSINTPAVEIGVKLGVGEIIRHAKNLGIRQTLKPETGTILGSSEVTSLEMATAYGTFANRGIRVNPIAITSISTREGKILYEAPPPRERSQKALSPQDAYLMVEGMRSVFYYGTAASENDMGDYAAGKTGTSNNSRDNWFCGFTPNLATVVWVGSDRAFDFLGKATGTSLALPLWAHYMRQAVRHVPAPPFERPVGIISKKVHPQYGYTTTSGLRMYFKKGHEPTREHSDLKVLSETGRYRTLFEN